MDAGLDLVDLGRAELDEPLHVGVELLGGSPERVATADARLSPVATQVPLKPVITVSGVGLESCQSGVWAASVAVFAGVAALDRAGVWERLKARRNDICHARLLRSVAERSAVDHGPNCASMVSMRAYRQRKKGAQG